MLNKLLAYLLTLCMIFSCISVGAEEKRSVVYMTNAVACADDIVELQLVIDGNNGFVNLGLEIEYDKSVMTLMSVEGNPDVGATCTTAQNIDAVPYNIGWDSTENVYFNGTLATFVFRVKSNAYKDKQMVYVDYYKGRNGNYIDGASVNYDEYDNPLNLTYEPGCIMINEPVSPPNSGGSGGGGGIPEDSVAAMLSTNVAKPGETVDINLELYNNTGFANLGFEIDYDSSIMSLVSANGNPSVGATFTSAQTVGTKPYNLGWDSVSNVYFNGTLATLTFRIADDAPVGFYTLQLSYYKGRNGNYVDGDSVNYDENENPVCIRYIHGCIEVEESEVTDTENYRIEFVSEKSTYCIGEEFDVQVWMYSEDTVLRIFDDEYTVNGFDSTKAGICSVTVSYGGFSKTFEVEVIDNKPAEPVKTYVVQTDTTEGVTISPSGYSVVNEGTILKYMITAQEGYIIDYLTVNGVYAITTNGVLSFAVDSDTVVKVSAVKKSFDIEAMHSPDGRVEVSTASVEYGGSSSAIIIPDEGYIVADVIVDGVSVGACRSYKFTDVKENHFISAVFEKVVQTVNVVAVSGKGGSVYPAKALINSGSGAKFTAAPDYGYHLLKAEISGKAVEVDGNDIFLDNICDNSLLEVSFGKNLYEVSASNAEGASIYINHNGAYSENVAVPYMNEVEAVINVENGYKLNALYVNDTPVKAEKSQNGLVYRFCVKKDTVISARCGRDFVCEFNQAVEDAGLAAYINADNALVKKSQFEELALRYSLLSDEEKTICTSAYATVLAAIDRANAYIALNDSDIIAAIANLPETDKISSDNYRLHKERIYDTFGMYEELTSLSKSLIDYSYVSKLKAIKEKTDRYDRESKNIISYLYGLIKAVPDDITNKNLSAAYSALMLAENTYAGMNDDDKELVSDDMLNNLFVKHGNIVSMIQKLYVTPFTAKVLKASPVAVTDGVDEAEAKRAVIYDIMNVYHSFPAYVVEQISSSAIKRLDALFDSAAIKVASTVNNIPVDMHGDFDENTKLVLSDPEPDKEHISSSIGKSLYQAIDVKMYSDNKEVQPTSKIRIRLEISKAVSQADVSVVYIDDSGNLFDVQGTVFEELGKYYISFFVDHFSSFAVVYDDTVAEKADIVFDTAYLFEGDSLTAEISGAVNASDCNLWMVGYSAEGNITFVEKSSDGYVSATVADGTDKVKAMLWNEKMKPVSGVKEINVSR